MSYREDSNQILKEARWTLGKIFIYIILPIITLCIIGGIITFSLGILSQPGKIIQKTVDADNILYNYEYFKQTYRDVLATDSKIISAQQDLDNFKLDAGERDRWTFEDKNESSRLTSVLTGLKNYRQDVVAQYNARAKMLNRKLFMGKDVPPEIE